ncbi:MAG: hypothetical protein JNL36_03495 [Candidatus Kapabacteria bacterium]|nr:hypothetical protein [Candidatus Kapabacteria bacterium]
MAKINFEIGDSFQNAVNYDLTILCGHIGLNSLGATYKDFKRNYNFNVENPFLDLDKVFTLYTENKQIVFLSENENHGINDSELVTLLIEILTKANSLGIKSILFNGVSNIDKGMNTQDNVESDDKRVRLMVEFIKFYLTNFQTSITEFNFIDLKDSYTRLYPNSIYID